MQNYLKLLIGLTLIITPTARATLQVSPIQVSAACRNNSDCIFDGSDIVVDITITNTSRGPIGIPVEYIDRKGPSCILTDIETGNEFTLRTGFPKRSLLEHFTQIPAGASITTEKIITVGQITALRGILADFTAKFIINSPFKIEEHGKPIYLQGSATLRIVGKEKFDQDNK